MSMKRHGLWMVVGCVLPLLVIFLLPIVGVRGNGATFIFILLMFACHLGMMSGHRRPTSRRGGDHGGH